MSTVLSLDEVESISHRMLTASGASVLQADPTARSIREAEAEGLRPIGLSYLPVYCQHVAIGKVRGDAVPSVTRPRPATVVVDAGLGFCHPAYVAGEEPLVAAAGEPRHVQRHPLVPPHHVAKRQEGIDHEKKTRHRHHKPRG